MQNILKISKICVLSLAIAGCNSIPGMDDYHDNKPDNNYAMDRAMNNDEWLQNPAVQRVFSNVGETIKKPNEIPYDIRDRNVEIRLTPNSTIQDLLTAISNDLNISTIYESNDLAEIPVYIPFFDGKLGNLLDSISTGKNVSFTWDSGVLTLKENASYMLTIPQDEEFMGRVTEELAGLGAVEINNSVSAGVVFYKANPDNQEKIVKYYERLINNSALITLQVMVINVNIDRQRQEGFDWSRMQALIGDLENSGVLIDGNGDNNLPDGNDNGDSGDEGGNLNSFGEVANVTGNSFAFNIARDGLNLTGLFNLLSTYGNTNTTQDVSLKTISGKQVVLESNQKIPYVSDVELSTFNEGFSNSGIETDTAENGITVQLLPYYESNSNLVSINIELSLQSLLGFTELSAGNQLGNITQPRTQVQSFNNTIRVPAGDTVIIGGVTYESISDNRSTLTLIENADVANQNIDLTNNSLFVLVRPTVVLYKNEEERQELN